MKTRTTVMVVLGTGVVFALGLVVVVVAGRLLQGFRETLSSETARQQFIAEWQPPAEAGAPAVFPGRIAGFTAEAAAGGASGQAPDGGAVAGSSALPVQGLKGLRMTYRQAGRADITVFAAQATELEVEAILQRFRARFEGRSGTRTVVEVPGRLRLASGNPSETVEVWSLKGWLFCFQADGELDAGFIRAYLQATSGRSARQL